MLIRNSVIGFRIFSANRLHYFAVNNEINGSHQANSNIYFAFFVQKWCKEVKLFPTLLRALPNHLEKWKYQGCTQMLSFGFTSIYHRRFAERTILTWTLKTKKKRVWVRYHCYQPLRNAHSSTESKKKFSETRTLNGLVVVNISALQLLSVNESLGREVKTC